MSTHSSRTLNRRSVLRWGAAAAAVPAAAGAVSLSSALSGGGTPQAATSLAQDIPFPELEEITIAELRSALDSGRTSARDLVDMYLARIDAIDRNGPKLNSIMEINPEAQAIADALDQELQQQGPRGPLHGIPVLLKDNIDTADQMLTTAGSLALTGSRPQRDATVVQRLRDAGAVILGKTTLSEWANFRGFQSSSGWSGRGGQCLNPYVLDRSPCGSSSGSPAAVSANLAVVAIGTETDGSIVCPSYVNGVVGLKPTVGLTSRAGVIPIAHSQDTVGPHGRTVADVAAVLGVLAGADPRDPMTEASNGQTHTDYTQFLDPNALQGARIGVPRNAGFFGYSRQTDIITEAAIQVLRDLGAEVIDPADFPNPEEMVAEPGEFEVLLYEFKADLNAYLADRQDPEISSLEDLIRFNDEHADEELLYFGQEIFHMAQEKGPLTDQVYTDALAKNHRFSREEGIDAILEQHNLDALIAPTGSPAWKIDLINGDLFLGASSSPAAMAGYPLLTVPAGHVFGLPVGLTFMGTAYSEPTLIKLAYAFEQATRVRQVPRFLPTSVEPGGVLSAIEGPQAAGFGTPVPLDATPVEAGTPTVEPAT
ncbi:MAG: Putative secreted amidase SCO6344 [uncultured Thermomicrobiales bacterium]|uniref:Secreted amidase SCO6344 n=1 Tax=uncultured Thermomicrobiales bacterium TaxID=1645740 RepID=A0A6J4ULP5_9BACT|nr:MAG: Putative secreted amidase SCO6344 [uncultured Thermomicrobiales bacterium]